MADLESIIDSFEQVQQLAENIRRDASKNSISFKDRVQIDRWFDALCETYASEGEDFRLKLRDFFKEKGRGWVLFDYVDKLLATCNPNNAPKILKKALIILCVENQSIDYREFDLRVEKVWHLAIQVWGSSQKIFGDVVDLADKNSPSSRGWSSAKCFKHWQNLIALP